MSCVCIGTSDDLTDLSNLNSYGTYLNTLCLDNDNVDLSTIGGLLGQLGFVGGQYFVTYAGFHCNSYTLLEQLENMTSLTQLSLRLEGEKNWNGNILDLSKLTNLQTFYCYAAYFMTKLPSSVTTVDGECAGFIFTGGTVNIYIHYTGYCEEQDWKDMFESFNSLTKISKLNIGTVNDECFNLSFFSLVTDCPIEALFFSTNQSNYWRGTYDLSYLSRIIRQLKKFKYMG